MASQVIAQVEFSEEGLKNLSTICYFGSAVIRADPQNIEQVSRFVSENLHRCTLCVQVSEELGSDEIVSLLNNGVSRVFLSQTQFEKLADLPDYSRLVVKLAPSVDAQSAAKHFRQAVEHVRRAAPNVSVDLGTVALSILKAVADDSVKFDNAYATCAEITVYATRCAMAAGLTPIVASSLFIKNPEGDFVHSIESLFTYFLRSDRPDGLYTTAVVDERETLLGVVYSNEHSIREALKHGRGIYWSRVRGLWPKGESSGDIQELIHIDADCDSDTLRFVVWQKGDGFCHLKTATCFGPYAGLSKLQKTLESRKASAPPGSYTSRLFSDPKLLNAKIMEEASELCEAKSKEKVAAEAADLLYFALAKCTAAGVTLDDVEKNLDLKSLRVFRRKGDAKPQWAEKFGFQTGANGVPQAQANGAAKEGTVKEAASVPKAPSDPAGTVDGRIAMRRLDVSTESRQTIEQALQRPSQRSTEEIMGIIKPIIERVQSGGDAALLQYTHNFEKATSLTTPVLHAPFPKELMQLPQETIDAIDLTFNNIQKFHAAQKETHTLQVETMPGVICSRFARPIESVGLYVPGGTAVLPSTALMLGVPAMVAGCTTIVLASPPRKDGTLSPEVVYVAHRVEARSIVLAGGAQAVAALAYGTESVPKVDKILGPGNQFVTAAKMLVATDTGTRVAIDMPAGPSEVLVVADATAPPAFVAADLLSQAEHGVDSQVVLLAVALDEARLHTIEEELNRQANALPRVDIVRGAIEHSVTLVVQDIDEALAWSNWYAPEHLILQVRDAAAALEKVKHAGSVFVGPWTPESVGDYSAGVNHSLREFFFCFDLPSHVLPPSSCYPSMPDWLVHALACTDFARFSTTATYGYAKQYSGVNLASFTKHITSSTLTPQGLRNLSGAVLRLAAVEELDAHGQAVSVRLKAMDEEAGT